jgi:ankyrin repeat protein
LFNLILQWSNGELGTELYVFRNAADALINQGVDINGVERLLNDEFRLHPGIYDLDRQRSMMRVLGVVRSHCHLEGQTLQRQPTGFPPPAREPEFRAPPPAQGQFPPGAVEFRTVTRSLRDMLRDPQHRRDLNTQNDEGETPLFIAVINRDEDNVRAFLECPETGVNIPNGNGLTPLHAAVELGFTNIAILLIRDRRTNVNAQNGEGNTPLLLAAMRENAEIVQILLQHPAININAQNREGNTLLHLAVMEGNAEIVQILLQRPAININAQNREGNTLLHLAAMRENARIVQILLQRPDINVDIPNGDGITARMIIDDLAAREEGFMQ